MTVMTMLRADATPVGLTVNSFASVSLDPPLMLWSLAAKSPSLGAFRAAGHFCVNVLAAGQEALCRRFATPAPDKFAGVTWRIVGRRRTHPRRLRRHLRVQQRLQQLGR